MNCDAVFQENKAYWTQRAAGYSQVNQWELKGENHVQWRQVLCREIEKHFPGAAPQDIRVLEVGTGPGFLAIVLAEAGYRVTAIDLTESMLEEAKKNAGDLQNQIDFRLMNAEELSFPDGSFDVIVSRNLTWNLPHPEQAYAQWRRVLKKDGLLLNFDANWYRYLVDEQARDGYAKDRENSAAQGCGDQNVGQNFDAMERIAWNMPLTSRQRPGWDREVLTRLGMTVQADVSVWKQVWSQQEKTNFGSTPMFLIHAVRC